MSTWLRLTLITMTVGGGFTGIAISTQILFSPQVAGPALVAISIVFLLLHMFVLVSGLLFVHNSTRVMPLVVALAIQIPYISSPLITYRFGDGLFGVVGIAETGLIGRFHFGSYWQFNLLQPLPWGLGVNLVAVAMLVALGVSVSRQRRVARSVASVGGQAHA